MKIRNMLLGCTLTLGVIVSGCGSPSLTGGEIVGKVLAAEKNQQDSYASEAKMRNYEGGQLKQEISVNEWFDAATGKRLVETTTGDEAATVLNDGKQLLIYEKGKDVAYTFDLTGSGDMPSQKDQIKNFLENIKNTHKVDVIGEEKLLDRTVTHIKATPQEKETLFGKAEFWIDQKTWHVMKSIMENGDAKSEVVYTKMEWNPAFTEKTFQIELPPNVKVTRMEDVNPAQKITLEEAQAALEKPFLYWDLPELKQDIELSDLKGEFQRKELTLSYTKDDVPYVSLSIFPVPKDDPSLTFPGSEKVTIRGKEGLYLKDIQFFMWDEDGMRYSLEIQHPDLKKDEVLKLADKMVSTKK
ncbi:hypothetical protein NDK47_03835 [Brevibacillus ruminantium]|uniref:Outer membrane lipoprotein carrier protein LolA n=1 Tax=Brevibacillus ruminantium TaxID=2950604 RepID=A0ABY4WHU6_9BACL|nr:hypothetical protein [Brevibacillus ruminantium]USG66444.1 hypothetical protein NDK47_03835 [Brevibacillus ruminantium]